MKNRSTVAVLLPLVAALLSAGIPPLAADADLLPGSLGDFEDGTIQGWGAVQRVNSTAVAGGPVGSAFFLQVTPAPQLAAANTGFAGVIDPAITDVTVDLLRPSGQGDLEMRLVLHGPGLDRWTSTVAELLPGDGVWRNYSFSILEADLTRVRGTGSYSDLEANLSILQVRHQAGAPSQFGTSPRSIPLFSLQWLLPSVFSSCLIPHPSFLQPARKMEREIYRGMLSFKRCISAMKLINLFCRMCHLLCNLDRLLQ